MSNGHEVNFSDFVKIQIDDVISSPEDKRFYRGLQLKNDLNVLLISDPTTDKSAAAIDVNTGHLHDPKNLPGLAHFCEHMLFLGTEKYPVENEYHKFLSSHGGGSNAYTDTDHTNYHFDVAPEHLEAAFDRFSQFFISPLFTESGTEREVLAVDSEHTNNVKNDSWRYWQLQRTLSNKRHAFMKFGTGNRRTLFDLPKEQGIDTRTELLKFHQDRYSANRMSMAILGKESLDDLAKLVAPVLSRIENKNLPKPEWQDHPYGPEELCTVRHIVPIKDLKSMHVIFPIPDLDHLYKSNPSHYLSHLIGHEGPGSLLSDLKQRGWVNGLSAGPHTAAKGFGFFSIDFDLSPDGLDHTEEILQLLFQYIEMLRQVGPLEWVHREVESLNQIHFRFQDKVKPQSYVTKLARMGHTYPLKEILYAPYMMSEYKPKLIEDILNRLIPSNFTYTIKSQSFKGKTDQIEEFYGTEYSCSKIDPTLLDKLEKTTIDGSQFKLPEKNEFIPSNFELFPQLLGKKEGQKILMPAVIKEDALTRVWFKQDDEYLLPKCCVYLHMRNPVVYTSPLNCALSTIFGDLFRDSLTEYAYNAELAGLKYSFFNGRYGYSLNLEGYNEKQGVFLENLMEKMTEFQPKKDRFEILKERCVRSLKNFEMEQPYQHAVYYTSVLITDRIWTNKEVLKEAEDITIEQLNDFIPRFFEALHIEAFIHGNSNDKIAQSIVGKALQILNASLPCRPLFPSQLTMDRSVDLPIGQSFRFEHENKCHANSALEVILQTGLENPQENMLLQLADQILSEPCFDELRTKEQLGYVVFCGVHKSNGSQGLRFIIQGEKSPQYMESRLEAFLKLMLKKLEEMTQKEFDDHKQALVNIRLEKPKRMSQLAKKYWGEITNRMYHFDRDQAEVDVLKTFTKEDILNFYNSKVAYGAPERKKLSVYIPATSCSSENIIKHAEEENISLESQKIEDVDAFKAQMPLCPLPKPYRPVEYLNKN